MRLRGVGFVGGGDESGKGGIESEIAVHYDSRGGARQYWC